MKYENITQTTRNQALVEYEQAHPDMSLEEIGRKVFKISKQRVSAILKRDNPDYKRR